MESAAQSRMSASTRGDGSTPASATREDGSVSNILGGVGHVLILDRDGHEIGSWGNLASSPHGIWVNQAGEIYLADTGFHYHQTCADR